MAPTPTRWARLSRGVTSGQFTSSPDDETDHDIHYGIYLTVTDSNGLKHTAVRKVHPVKSTFTLASAPSGLKLYLDGSPHTTPHAFQANAGVNRTLEAPICQTSGTTFYRDPFGGTAGRWPRACPRP